MYHLFKVFLDEISRAFRGQHFRILWSHYSVVDAVYYRELHDAHRLDNSKPFKEYAGLRKRQAKRGMLFTKEKRYLVLQVSWRAGVVSFDTDGQIKAIRWT